MGFQAQGPPVRIACVEFASTGAVPARAAEPPSWWGTILAVIAGSIAAWALLILVALPLAILNVIPLGTDSGDAGWPWRIDGPWSVAADLGPTLAVAIVVAFCVAFYLTTRTGVRPRRWPLALVAVTVGWLPVTGGARGLLAVSGTVAFVAIVFTARRWALAERRPLRWSRPVAVAILVAGLALAAVSVSYGALHPLTAKSANGRTVALKHGHSGRVAVTLENRGPLDARILGVSVPGAPGLRVERARTDDPDRHVGPTIESLMNPLAGSRVKSGQSVIFAYLNLSAAACGGDGGRSSWNVDDLNFRLRVAGLTRTQTVHLAPSLRVICR
jgi:hypothetical protein